MSGAEGGAVTSLLELRLRAGAVDGAAAALARTLTATRAFAGCRGVEVTVDVTDGTHVVVVEHWDSLDADDAYRAWRATPEGASELGALLAEPPRLTRLRALPGA